jgi:hypothetical protein
MSSMLTSGEGRLHLGYLGIACYLDLSAESEGLAG